MRFFSLVIAHLIFFITGFCQVVDKPPLSYSKTPLTTGAFGNWLRISESPDPIISNNGRYVIYSIRNLTVGIQTMIIQEISSQLKIQLQDITKAEFTNDSRRVVYLKGTDSLFLYNLANDATEFISCVTSYRLFMQGQTEWIACQIYNKNQLQLRNLRTGLNVYYDNVSNYLVSDDGNTLVLQNNALQENDGTFRINLVNLYNKTTREIWKGNKCSNLLLGTGGKKLAFLSQDSTTTFKSIWLYDYDSIQTTELVGSKSKNIPKGMEIAGIAGFSKNGKKLFIHLKFTQIEKSVPGMVQVNIWNYADPKLQSQQLKELQLNDAKMYLGVLSTTIHSTIILLQHENETIDVRTDDIVLVTSRKGDPAESYWNKEATGYSWLIDISKGERKKIALTNVSISTNMKYVWGYGIDESWRDIFVYEIATGLTRNITANLPIPLQEEGFDMLYPKQYRGLGVAGWVNDDQRMLIYDNYDIWYLDPMANKLPIRLTEGRNKKWRFRLVGDYNRAAKAIGLNDKLLVSGFNAQTKQSGFFWLQLGLRNRLEKLFAGDYVFNMIRSNYRNLGFPLKSRDANTYLVLRENCEESPNIFSTLDFKLFTPISHVYPEKAVNWFTSELINFKTSDSIPTQAILYKPGNFDPRKKYPLLIHYYDKSSDKLNQYIRPAEKNGALDVPWFVSHEYLVLVTDIHFSQGGVGQNAKDAVEAAVLYISRRPYIDRKYIGIQGHSFGGYETNYLLTHSNMFAAAVSSSGVSDITLNYGSVWGGGNSKQQQTELRQYRMGTTPWQSPDLYLKNSPIYFVSNVATPVLMVNNRNDHSVEFQQGLLLFTSLRRAGKVAWMLEYDKGGHGLYGAEYKDYMMRISQFFDHYLKCAPAPIWMTQGIPARLKGLITGYDLDPAGNCGKDCKVCKVWNEKWKKDSTAMMKEIREKIKTELWMGSAENK